MVDGTQVAKTYAHHLAGHSCRRTSLDCSLEFGKVMSHNIQSLIRRFYNEIWNSKEFDVAEEILQPDLSFRGSLGAEIVGIERFLGYVDGVHGSLSNYNCEIHSIINDEGRAAARLVFSGTHTGVFLGIEPTGRQITWDGAAFFTVRDDKIGTIWVLGDVDVIKQQLAP